MARCCATFVGEAIGYLILTQSQEDAPTIIEGTLRGLKPGRHGLQVHVFGDFSDSFNSTGAIFNPFGRNHGGPDDEERMVGDLGNIEAGEDGTAYVSIEDRLAKLIGPHSIIGRSLIITASDDDLGRGGHELSLSTGNSGAKVAGGIVGIASS